MQVDSDLDADGEYLAQSEHVPSETEQHASNLASTSTSLHNDSKLQRTDYSADPALYGLRRSVSTSPLSISGRIPQNIGSLTFRIHRKEKEGEEVLPP